MKPSELKAVILGNPATSYWLRDALRKCELRDPLDMARDAAALKSYCECVLANIPYARGKECD